MVSPAPIPRVRFEEEVLSPAIRDFFAGKDRNVRCEFRIPLPGWRAGCTRTRFVRLDVVASDTDGQELTVVETKAACYPQLIGTAVGELLLYKHILLQNTKLVIEELSKFRTPDL